MRIDQDEDAIQAEAETRSSEMRALRQKIQALSRELEVTVSRRTDNQEVIRGIQAFVRLIAQSATPNGGTQA